VKQAFYPFIIIEVNKNFCSSKICTCSLTSHEKFRPATCLPSPTPSLNLTRLGLLINHNHHFLFFEMTSFFRQMSRYQRWAESEKLTSKPDPEIKTPNPAPDPVSLQILDSEFGSGSALCPSLPCFYIHSIYIITFIPNPDPVFSENSNPVPNSDSKNKTGLRIRSGPGSVPSSAK